MVLPTAARSAASVQPCCGTCFNKANSSLSRLVSADFFGAGRFVGIQQLIPPGGPAQDILCISAENRYTGRFRAQPRRRARLTLEGVITIIEVSVRENNVEQALRVLKKKMQREGIYREMKLRKHYEKPSLRKTREKEESVRRARKMQRKKRERDGY